MTFSVTKMAPELVSPSETTPSGHLPFSVADETVVAMPELILVFSEGKEPAKVIREALAKALVPYYPVAGRHVKDSENVGRLQVALTGEGVPFVEASVDCTLQDVNYIQKQPLMIPKEQLLPSFPGDTDHSTGTFKLQPIPFMMQVTQFNCGGFTVGIKFNHTMFDGMGAGQFIVAMSEMARGLGEPTIKPVWCRESMPCPRVTIPNMPDLPSSDGADPSVPITKQPSEEIKLARCVIDLSLDYINQLKDQFTRETGEICTTFDISVAKVWQCRTRAIDLQPDVTVSLGFPVNVRRLLNHILSSEGIGYYGNCVCIAAIEAPSEQITNASLFDIVKLIKQGKQSVLGNREILERLVLPPPGPLAPGPPAYDQMVVVDWRRLGFYSADYGWGTPKYVVPLDEHSGSFGLAYLVNSPPPMKGIRLLMHSVAEEHFGAFLNGMNGSS